MKSNIKAFFGHRAVQAVTFSILTIAVIAGSYVYADRHHLFDSNGTPSVTWLTRSNVAEELNIQQSSTGAVTAKPGQPVLLIECPTETCDSAGLNIPAVMKQFDGKVKILAINPYSEKDLAAALEQSFIIPAVQNAVVSNLAQSVAQQKAGADATITAAQVQAVMQDSSFQSQVQQVLASPQAFEQLAPSLYALLQPIYPKFFLFDSSFQMVNAATGIDITSQNELSAYVHDTLAAVASAGSGADESATPATTGGATTPSTSPSTSTSSSSAAPSPSDSSAASGSGK